MTDIDDLALIRLRKRITDCLVEADARRLLDVGIGLAKAYEAIDDLIVARGGPSVPPPILPE